MFVNLISWKVPKNHILLSVRTLCLSVRKVYSGKTADWIWMLFGVASGVGRGMGVLDGVHLPQGEGRFWGVLTPIV